MEIIGQIIKIVIFTLVASVMFNFFGFEATVLAFLAGILAKLD